jgi:hypothetical protein
VLVMPEGVAAGGQVLAGGVHDDPDAPPPPGPDAPKGWTWDRGNRHWKPKIRGRDVWRPEPEPDAAAGDDDGGGEGDRDPAPSWLSDDAGSTGGGQAPAGRRRLSIEDVPRQVTDDMAGLAGLIGTPVLAVLGQVDPYCAGALRDSFGQVVDATLPLICRSERIVSYFREDTADWLLWGKLAMALAPVGRAIIDHHVTRTVTLIRDPATGQVSVLRGEAARAARAAGEDPLQPAQQAEYNYAV